jgi:RHS repeat-associated protein
LLTESRSKIAGFTADETQRTYSVDALGNWQQQVTEERVADRLRIERATSNGSVGEAVTVYHGGLMVEQRRPADTVSTRMTYDALGRLISSKQPHHAHASSTVYATGKNQVISRSDPTGSVTSYGYFPQGLLGAGRVASVTYADATVRRSAYDIRGNMTNEWGSATAPTSYGFDGYNQLETLSTYRTTITADSALFPSTIGTADVTTWVRQEATGLLTQKKYAYNQGPVYLYDIAGRITRRTLARGSVTDYTYTAWGQPDVTNYTDATPDADIDYDRMGRKTRESNGTATSTYQYSATTLRPTLETITYDLNRDGTPELTRQLDRTHDNLRRPTGFTLKDGATTETAATYGYDPYSRLSQISNPQISNQIFTYSYLQNSNLLAQVTGPVHTVTNTWELDRDVLDAKENKVGSVTVSKLDYSVNAIGQRTALSQTGTAFASVRGIAWGYDSYGQVTSADSTLATQDRAYQYDAIGNRKKSATSLTLPATDNYTSNSLNQYSSLSIPNPQSPISNPIYDLDGNATSYPLPVLPNTNSTLTWDGENRLTSTIVNGLTTTQQFDATGRRISKTTGTTTRLYLYDAWNVIAEYERGTGVSPVLALKKTYLWGTDLSGTLQGAGGVGGLLLITDHSALLTSHYPTYDGNGNISEYLTSTGSVAAHFEYDPFGNATINTDATNQFTYKFSTKPQDVESGLYYYGLRSYDPKSGRWINRDPIEERGGNNCYGMVGNENLKRVDFLGLSSADEKFMVSRVIANRGSVLSKVDWKLESSIVISGSKKCIICENGSKGYLAIGEVKGRAFGEIGFSPWRVIGSTKAAFGAWVSWDGWVGGRIFAGVSGSVSGMGSYDSCTNNIEWSGNYDLSAYAGVNLGAKLQIDGFVDIWPINFDFSFGVEATITGKVTGRWRPTLSCSGGSCTIGGPTSFQADVVAKISATIGKFNFSYNYNIGDTGELDAGYFGIDFPNPISNF